MSTVCIVTNEIFPFDRGGVARLAYNFAKENRRRGSPAEIHFLVPVSFRPKLRQVEAEFEGLAKIHVCNESLGYLGPLGKLIQQFGPRDSIDSPMIESLRYLAGLLDAQRELGKEFDVVEFPDFGGWASATIAAKRSGIALANALIAVRLHSSLGLIVDHEPFLHEPSDWLAAICDLERKALLDADLVIAHVHSTAVLNREHFGFSDRWMEKVRIGLPPITLTEIETGNFDEPGRNCEADSVTQNFLFSSRLQGFKRPDLFVRAAVYCLDRGDARDRMFRVASYGWDRDYIDWLRRLVPARWQRHIEFLDNVSPQERARLLRESILVIPSDFESLCLLAYEARQLAVKLILNRRCRAFSAEPQLWREGQDCLFFEGDFVSLADAMLRALQWTPAPAKTLKSAEPYWEVVVRHPCPRSLAPATPLSHSCILYGTADLDSLGRRIGELRRAFAIPDLHVLAPRQAFESADTPAAAWQVHGITIHQTGWHEPTPSEVQSVVSKLSTDAVAFLPFDFAIEQGFWEMACECLASQPDVAAFTSHLGYDDPGGATRLTLNWGNAPTIALIADRIAHRASVFRRDALVEFGIREEAGERWHEDLCLRLVGAGRGIVVAPAILASQRGGRFQSRIASSRFFATHRDEAARRLGAPYRQGSASMGWIDSIESIDHAGWVAREEETAVTLRAAEHQNVPTLRFKDVVLKNTSAAEDGSYAELEIALEGMSVGRVPIDWLAFKLIRHMSGAQIEFRDGGNARRFFRDWPPATSDRWGAVAVWSGNNSPHPHRAFFEKAGTQDSQRLQLLLENLSEIVRSLPLSESERAQWLRVAKALQRAA